MDVLCVKQFNIVSYVIKINFIKNCLIKEYVHVLKIIEKIVNKNVSNAQY